MSSAGNISPESLGERVSENLVLTDAVGKIRFCLLYSEWFNTTVGRKKTGRKKQRFNL